MLGVKKLLDRAAENEIIVSTSTRRGVFWQDLNTAIVTNTSRTLTREDFPEFLWGTAFKVGWSRLPVGFKSIRELLGDAISIMLQDLYVLQRASEDLDDLEIDSDRVHDVDNKQACLEARIQEGLQSTTDQDGLVACILLAAYLFSYCLFTGIWDGTTLPQMLSGRLLHALQTMITPAVWKEHDQVLFWCTVVGGTLSPSATTRMGYVAILQSSSRPWSGSFIDEWDVIQPILSRFLWSKKRFGNRGKRFWESSSSHPVH